MTITQLSSLFLFLSGAASLIYQVTWVRLLSLSIGSTSVSVGLVLATFFLGLALGSFLVTRIAARHLNGIRPYLVVEALIALSALVLLPLLLHLDQWVAFWPVLGQFFIVKAALVVVLLLLPTLCIGATYPLMVSLVVRERSQVGVKLSWLYAVNTLGAVAGAAGGGFLFIPAWGLDGAIYFAVALNLVVVALGLRYRQRFSLPPIKRIEAGGADDASPHSRGTVLVILFVTGLVALASEVAWTKYLAIFTHTTIYGFSAILTVFLLGIAAGAWFIKQRIDGIKQPQAWVVWALCWLALALLLARVGLEYLPTFHAALVDDADAVVTEALVKYGLILLILFPPTFLFGALFTLNIRLFCGPLAQLHRSAGSAYAVNTLGGIVGSLLAGLWLIPRYGSDATLSMAIVLVALTSLLLWRQLQTRQHRGGVIVVVATVLLGSIYLPHLNFGQIVLASRYYFDPSTRVETPPEFLFLKEGRSSVVSVTSADGVHFRLQNNSLPEASVKPPDPFSWFSETMLGLFPYLFQQHPAEVFIVGLGAGNTLSAAALTNASAITVVELEPAVEEATRVIFDAGVAALKDPRVTLVFDDARHRLLIDNKRYDAIISQPSHPWLAGSGNLFTQEYFELVASRLKPGGVSVQWVNLMNMDATTLRSIYQAYFGVFPYGMTFMVRYESSLILVASNQPLYFDHQLIARRMNEPAIHAVLERWEVVMPFELYRYFSLSRAEALMAAGDSVANSDTRLIPEMRLAWLTQRPGGDEDVIRLLGRYFKFDIETYIKTPSPRWDEALQRYLLYKQDRFRYRLFRQRLESARLAGEEISQ